MKHTKEEIIDALKVIKYECEIRVESCHDCPFYVGHVCEITTRTPNNWMLNNAEPEAWRALK